MSLQADPYALRFAASRFSAGAGELLRNASLLIAHKSQLVSHDWKGTASQAFDVQSEQQSNFLRQTATVLEQASSVLNSLASQVERVMELQRQAEQYERASWEYDGDTLDDLHHRQNLARQAAYYRQQAEWEARQADSMASSQLHQIMAMIPQVMVGGHNVGRSNDMTDLPEPMRSYYKRHPELWEQDQERSSKSLFMKNSYAQDRNQLLDAFREYYKSKQPDYYPDESRRIAAEEYLRYLYDLSNEQLFDRLQDLLSNDEKAQYYQKLVKDPNFDAKNQLKNDPEYKKYAIRQGAENETPGSTVVAGLSFSIGIIKALQPRYKPDQGISSGEEVENSNEIGKSKQAHGEGTGKPPTKQTVISNKGTHIDVTPLENHTTTTSIPHPARGVPNTSVDIIDQKTGEIKTRRYYGADGNAIRDVDFTNHGNPKQHPEWPHEHRFEWNDDGTFKRR